MSSRNHGAPFDFDERKEPQSLATEPKFCRILTEIYQEPTVALPLVRWQRQDAGHVVIQEGIFLLKQIARC